jgi:hypothetical protein
LGAAKNGKRNQLAALRHVSFLIHFLLHTNGSVPSGFHVKVKSSGNFKGNSNFKSTDRLGRGWNNEPRRTRASIHAKVEL